MLPVLKVQSLVQVAEDQYASQALKQREKIRDSQADRDLAGFYVYQNYLKRLRRLHRNYVKKYRAMKQEQQQHHQQQQPPTDRGHLPPKQQVKQAALLPNSHLKNEFSLITSPTLSFSPEEKDDWPATKFRVQAGNSQELSVGQGKIFDQTQSIVNLTLLPQIASKGSLPTAISSESPGATWEEEEEEDGDLGREENPIYIPCGRENSELRLQRLKKKKQQGKDKSGALSFRMWRSIHGLSITPYST